MHIFLHYKTLGDLLDRRRMPWKRVNRIFRSNRESIIIGVVVLVALLFILLAFTGERS